MPIAVGDKIKTKDDKPEFGTVTKVVGSTVTYKTATGEVKHAGSSNLEAATGYKANLAKFGPDVGEVLANTVVFAGINLGFKKKITSKENLEFMVVDSIYEFILKKWAREMEDKIWTRKGVAQSDIDEWFSSQDFSDALSKTTSIAVMDGLYRLAMKKGFLTMGNAVYILKVLAAFYISNVGSRKLMGKKAGDPYFPQ